MQAVPGFGDEAKGTGMSLNRGARAALGMIAIGVVAMMVAGCSTGTSEGATPTTGSTSSTAPPPPVALSTGPVDQSVDVPPGQPVVATATDGKITTVSL